MFKTDGGGFALSISDAKISTSYSASTWNTKLSQIANAKGKVVICTYSLPRLDYLRRIFVKKSEGVTLIVNSKFAAKAMDIWKEFPKLNISIRPDVHAKMVLIEPRTVWLSSANFGNSGWFEHCIGIHSEEAYQYFDNQLKRYLYNSAVKAESDQ